MPSKTQRIVNIRKQLLYMFGAYAELTQDWDPSKEGDYEDLESTVDQILEKEIT